MSADPALVAALAADGAWPFVAVKVAMPAKTLRLLDGSSVLDIAGETYAGSDVDFGTLAAVEPVGEAQDSQAPELRIVFNPADTAALVDLADPDMQGSPVTIMVGCLNPATGLIVGTPETIFLGEVDVPTMQIGAKSRQVEQTAVSVFERLFEVDEGERATDGFHQSVYPGELGLEFVTGTADKLFWGTKAPTAAILGNAGSAWRNTNDPYYWQAYRNAGY